MKSRRYIQGLRLKEEGYLPEELLDGKYRPIFSSQTRRYFTTKKKYTELDRKFGLVLVPATKENLIRTARFNIRYGDEPYKVAGRKMLRRFGVNQ